MQKELTINVDERVYDELQRIGGPEDISQCEAGFRKK
jgi:hypothetical protein